LIPSNTFKGRRKYRVAVGMERMEKREVIPAIIGIIMIIIGLIIVAIVPDASTRFFVGMLVTWLGVILLGGTLTRKKFSR
jgi:uncharacterized membrane protein HdeD (DUF308 family)